MTNGNEFTVFIVDDDALARETLRAWVTSMSYRVVSFSSAEEFLSEYDQSTPGVLVCDIRMARMSGIELQQQLVQKDVFIPVIIITGYPSSDLAFLAAQNGAIAFLEKPLDGSQFQHALSKAIEEYRAGALTHEKRRHALECLARLTEKEQLVLKMIVNGVTNAEMATQLSLSRRTIEQRRRRIFTKLDATSVADLIRVYNLSHDSNSA